MVHCVLLPPTCGWCSGAFPRWSGSGPAFVSLCSRSWSRCRRYLSGETGKKGKNWTYSKVLKSQIKANSEINLTDIMSLVKHHHGFLGEFFRHQVSDLWVQQVVVAVHDDVGVQDLKGNKETEKTQRRHHTHHVCSEPDLPSNGPDNTDTSLSSGQSPSGRPGCRCRQEAGPDVRPSQTPATNPERQVELEETNKPTWSWTLGGKTNV